MLKNIIIRSLILAGLLRSLVMCSQTMQMPAPDIDAFPQLSVQNDSIDIEIASMDIGIKVFGNIAITSYDITFYNPSNRVLEGELNFPLKANQEIVGFSMDVDGKLRKGVVVEKHRGRQVFETIVREGIDPGLIEKTSGNNFRARVYPIMANGTKRIVIRCQEILSIYNSDYIYQLPMGFQRVIKDFSIKAEVVKGHKKPSIITNDFTHLNFTKWEESFVAEARQKTIYASGLFAFLLPNAGKKEFGIRSDDGQYFYATAPIAMTSKNKEKVSHIHLLWDVSGSGSNRNSEKEIDLLSAYLKYHGDLKVSLTPFNHVKHPTSDFTIINGDISDLASAIKSLRYDGGSCLENIPFDEFNTGEILLFSDGLINFGELSIKQCKSPLNIINSSLKADHSLMEHLALSNKGTYIDLSVLALNDALVMLEKQQITAEADNMNDHTSDVIITLSPNKKHLVMTGKVHHEDALLAIKLYSGSNELERYEMEIPEEQSYHDIPVARIWASQRINVLLRNKQKHKNDIISLATRYGVVSDYTSLMVLERLEDYIRFEVEPPAEWKGEYTRIKKRKKDLQSSNKDDYTQTINTYIKDYKEWWNTTFPQSKRSPKGNTSFHVSDQMDLDVPITRQEENTPPPPPPPAETNIVSLIMIEDSDMEEEACDTPPVRSRGMQVYTNAIPWDSTATYMTEISKLKGSEAYPYYISVKEKHLNQPSFFLDIAAYLFKINRTKEGVTVITNIAELQLEDAEVLRVAGHKLIEQDQLETGILVFKKIKEIRPEELQSYRDLALALEKAGRHQDAVDLMIEALHQPELRANSGIKGILLNEINSLLNKHPQLIETTQLPDGWRYNMPVSIRIVLSWSTDHSDVDLWITEPGGEQCMYSNNRTCLGGRLSYDVTNGYGPEEYLIKSARQGRYKIQANYFGDRRPSITGPITLYAEIFENYGTMQQTSRQVVLQLKEQKQVIDLGEVRVD
ncbi:VIT domain-containing protein [Carboxylicivirga sp. RSCT41]|uniref:VIT domain-containing protein n=1 Tax=Carboxylicivirga agarovorans TaxID=3417570 RepID=UPI003D33F9C2